MPVVVIGAIFVDLKGYPNDVYIPGGRNSGYIETVHGGVARNIAEDLANIGQSVRFISLTDPTGTGADVVEHLKRRGIDTRFIPSMPGGMGTWLAVFDEQGDVTAAISSRPNLVPLREMLLRSGDDIFSDAQAILLEMDLDRELWDIVLQYAEKYHLPIYAATSNISIAAQKKDLLKKTALFVCNLQEAELLFERDLSHVSEGELPTLLAECASDLGIRQFIATMGEKGSCYVSPSGSGPCPAVPVDVIDTTGAGDAFFAGACAALIDGKSPAEGCRFASKIASLVIATKENVCPVLQKDGLSI